MAEWKTDTEEIKEVVRRCRDFKESLQEKRCGGFIKELDSYALKIIVERRKIEMQLEKAIGELKKAKKERSGFWGFLGELGRDFGNAVGSVIPPVKLCTELCEKGLNLMEDNIEKWEHNVRLLERMLEIYSTQAKASVELVEGAWEGVKKRLHFYTDKHQEFIRRLKQASDAIDNEYNFPTPGVLMEYDFERPAISYTPKKSVFNERLKDLREDFSASLYADWKDKINAFFKKDRAKASKERELENLEDLMGASSYDENPNNGLERLASFKEQEFEKSLEDLMPSVLSVPSYNESFSLAKKHCVKNCKKVLEGFTEKIKEAPNDSNAVNEAFDSLERELEIATENLSQKIDPVLERNENYTQKALEYREFLEKEKEGFMVDEQNPYPDEVRFNALRLAEFDSVFSAIAPLEDLNKTACAHHALKALQSALKDNDLGFDATDLEQIAKGFIPRGYLWHFDANVLGNVALVREELLLGVKHTKGYSLWTEFLQTQN
ncbi:5-amino-6-(5-phosphoribosylamino)uracil reductase [Helicobacter pylori]|uniref:HNH endonuclease n=1 Tax=Helicobacter pylori TaxID=210 RepID=UPI000EB3A759|nr:HNH endonuclease [Helicobacter pylori]RKV23366.1 5-amino-6-(5-phosphoribosylamino)uracil reductase [Helicobacter pylori]